MAGAIRYRSGINAETGQSLVGAPHLAQSLATIWATHLQQRLMLLEFGSNLRGVLAEDLTPAIALRIYNELVVAAAKWEPEYVINQLQFKLMTADGTLGISHGGDYYPEGRYGNYDIVVPLTLTATRLLGSGRTAT